MVEGRGDNHAPVCVPWNRQQAFQAGRVVISYSRCARSVCTLQRHIFARHCFNRRAFTPIWNSVWPSCYQEACNNTKGSPVLIAVKSGVHDRQPGMFNGRRVISHAGMPSTMPRKVDVRKEHHRVSSTGLKLFPVTRVMLWQKITLLLKGYSESGIGSL